MTRALALALVPWLAACEPIAEGERVGVVADELRPDQPSARAAPPAYAEGDVVERFDSADGFFRVHFTRAGQHAVPEADADDNAVPDYVQDVAAEYDAVLAFFRDELGMREPLRDDAVTGGNGGDGRFDVYLLDFPNSADGAFRAEHCLADAPHRCTGYMLQENDFDGRSYPSLAIATRVLASHELFHAVQHAYDSSAGSVVGEGTAVWASEAYDASLIDFEALLDGYLEHPERSLGQEPSGPVDAFSYGSALFFQYLHERFGRELIRELWQALSEGELAEPAAGAPAANGPRWLAALDAVLARDHDASLASAYADFVAWNLHTGRRADATVSYAQGADYPEISEVALALPHRDQQVRVFPLSSRHYASSADADGVLQLAVIADEGVDLSGLRLLLARETRGRIAELQHATVSDQQSAVSLEVLEGERIHAVVLNTRRAGESSRPALCLGMLADVRACRAEIDVEPEPPAVVLDDSHEPDVEDADADVTNSHCAISTPGARSRTPEARGVPLWSWLALLTLAVARRRSRCGHGETSATRMRASGWWVDTIRICLP